VSNSLSPSNNTEKKGLTGVFNSITKLDTSEMTSGMSLNMRILPMLLKKEQAREKLADLVLGYFEKGGMHIQFNIVDQDILKDAQVHPENYQDLIVRVSGYNAYFINIEKGLQNDIIDRIQFENL